jgi:two-component system, NtrC family, response regulator GlrR
MAKPLRILLTDGGPQGTMAGLVTESIINRSELRVDLKRLNVNGQGQEHVGRSFADAISTFRPDLILLVLPMDSMLAFDELFQSVQKIGTDHPTIMAFIESQGDMFGTMTLMPVCGCIQCTPGSPSCASIAPLIHQLVRKECRNGLAPDLSKETLNLKIMIGKSTVFLKEIQKLPTVATCNYTVLISGETGTGKEVFAQAIHCLSRRANGPFIPVNCGAIPFELAENELFGHRTGAFTGATSLKEGLVQEAYKGTLFLDEVDSLPSSVQVKLLRFIQDRTYRALGSARERQMDVRIIAAMGTNPEEAVRSSRLRRDLFYRLNVISIKLPPLRDRLVDIPLLAQHFLRKYALELRKDVDDFSKGAMQKLTFYDWPGNIRELQHIVERAVVLSNNGKIIQATDIEVPDFEPSEYENSFREVKQRLVDKFEKTYLIRLLMAHHGNISSAAQAAQKHRRAFWALIRKHKIDVRSFKE